MKHFLIRVVPVLLAVVVAGCVVREEPDMVLARADSILRASAERGSEQHVVAVAHVDTVALGRGASVDRLSPLADTIADRLVFMTYGQRSLVAAGRAERFLLDLGRLDFRVESPAQRTAYLQAVAALSPVQRGDRFRIAAEWGSEDAAVTGFDVWNGRIVAVLAGSARADSAVKGKAPVVAAVARAESTVGDSVRTCSAGNSPAMVNRVRAASDSLLAMLRADTLALTAAQRRSARAAGTHVHGCFGEGRAIVLASLVVGDYDRVRELAVLVLPSGDAVPVTVADRRFKAHEALHALDADGDGVDDVAVRGRARRVGGTVVLRFDPERRRLEWFGEGFSWETL